MMKRFVLVVGFITMACGLSACGTIEGAGRDIQHAGEAIQRTF